MMSETTINERMAFSGRLKSTLESSKVSIKPTSFARAYNSRAGEHKVTVHAARKWLIGESIPTQSKLILLASWLRVDPAWLRFGEGEGSNPTSYFSNQESVELSTSALELIHDILALSESMQKVVRDMVNSLGRNSQ